MVIPQSNNDASLRSYRKQMIPVVIVALVFSVISGLFVFVIMRKQVIEDKRILQDKITQLKNNGLENAGSVSSLDTHLENEQIGGIDHMPILLKTKFSLDLFTLWRVEQVFQFPDNPNMFVFITPHTGRSQGIRKFDSSEIPDYLYNENINIVSYMTPLIELDVPVDEEFRGVGMDKDLFIFYKTNVSNSPQVCTSYWLVPGLLSINVNSPSVQPQPYTVPKDKLQIEQQKFDECLNALNTQ